jgi:hypothetical protein
VIFHWFAMHMVRSCRACSHPLGHRVSQSRTAHRLVFVRSTDYIANATDDGVLQLPLKQQLEEDQLKNVFGYDRDLHGRYEHCDSADPVASVRQATQGILVESKCRDICLDALALSTSAGHERGSLNITSAGYNCRGCQLCVYPRS